MIPNLCRLPVVLTIMVLLELLLIVHLLGLGSFRYFAWPEFALLSFYVQWIVLPSIWLLCRLRDWLNQLSESSATIIALVILLASTGVANLIFASFSTITSQQLLRDMAIVAVMTILGLRYCFVQQRWLQEQRANESARFAALQSRIQPHFLFNTMNSIASLLRSDVDKAEKAVEDLSNLLRRQINVDSQSISWREEREICEAYLRIEALRYGDRLNVEWDVGGLRDSLRLPPFIIQPLIENSVKHGIAPSAEAGKISVIATEGFSHDRKSYKDKSGEDGEPDTVTIIIENSVSTEFRPYAERQGDRSDSGPLEGEVSNNGIALGNVQDRLRSSYRDPETGKVYASLRVEQPSGKYRVVLTLPLCFSADRLAQEAASGRR